MKPWMDEVVTALDIGEARSWVGTPLLMALALGFAIHTPLALLHANDALMAPGEAVAFALCFFAAIVVAGNVVAWSKAPSIDALYTAAKGLVWPLVGGLGAACIPLVVWSGMANPVVLGGLGAIMGTASTFVLLFLGHLYTRTYIPWVMKMSFVGMAFGVLLVALVTTNLPDPWNYLLVAALSIANAPILVVLLRNAPAIGGAESFRSFSERKDDAGLFIAKIAVPLACVGLNLRLFQRHNETVAALLPKPDIMDDLNLVVLMLVTFVILCFAIHGSRSFRWSFAQLLSFLIPLVSLVGIVGVGTLLSSATPFDGGTLATFALLLALAWSFMGSASLEYLLRSVSVFGMSLGCIALGVLLGGLLDILNLFGTALGSIVAALTILVMAVGFLPARPAPNLDRSSFGSPLRSATDDVDLQNGAGDLAGEGEGDVEMPAPVRNLAEIRTAALESANRSKGRFIRRCEVVAQTFMLSNRESEVLVLLAKGRSMNHIMTELVISEGTAKTHINHVYKKLGVHSRHELLDLIESIEVDTVSF